MAAKAPMPAAGGLVCHTALVPDVAARERHSSISSPIAWMVPTWCWATHAVGACVRTRWRHSVQYGHFLRGPTDGAAMCEGSKRGRRVQGVAGICCCVQCGSLFPWTCRVIRTKVP
ncbi:unnamed protein product [Ixodes persulcatus]